MRDGARLIGQSDAMCRLRAVINKLALVNSPVLICGETGSGKELVARALHSQSRVAEAPFVAVNCGAMPQELIASEFFGSELGAFTGAKKRDGLLVSANGGTLFLDEVGELPLAAQAVLLRVLETGEVLPVGATRSRRVDFRLICATHRHLVEMQHDGQFRADLYHRVSALRVEVPPLRDRLDDIEALANRFGHADLDAEVLIALRCYGWPGNVRQLRNALTRASANAGGGRIHAEHIELEDGWEQVAMLAEEPLRITKARWVKQMLERHGGNVRATARVLEISPTTIYRSLQVLAEVERSVG